MTRILIIEDEDSYREATSYMLQREGFEVAGAANGAAGLAEYDRGGADLVLLDLMMPGMAGTEVCRQLRARGNPLPEAFCSIAGNFHSHRDNALVGQQRLTRWSEFRAKTACTEIPLVKAALGARLPRFPIHVRPPFVAPDERFIAIIRDELNRCLRG